MKCSLSTLCLHAAFQRNRIEFAARRVRRAWSAASRRQWSDAIVLFHPLTRWIAERNTYASWAIELFFVQWCASSLRVCKRLVVSLHVFHAHRAHAFDISTMLVRIGPTTGIECRETARPGWLQIAGSHVGQEGGGGGGGVVNSAWGFCDSLFPQFSSSRDGARLACVVAAKRPY